MSTTIKTQNFIKKAKHVHGDKYDYSLVNYVNSISKVKIICPIHGVFEQRPAKHLNNKRGCQICGGSKKMTTSEFINKAKYTHNDKYDYSLSDYKNNSIKVKIICPVHGIFEQSPNNHISKKHGCPLCSNNKKLTTNIFIDRCKKIHNNKYDYSLSKYVNAHSKIKIICPVHGVFEQTPNSHYQNIGCSKCKRSKGEEQIETILLKNKIKYITQKRFKNCTDKKQLPFDFYLTDYNLCIEYDGKQHFNLLNNFWGGEKTLNMIKKHDKIKDKYCEENNIYLLRIKYNDNINEKLDSIINITKNNLKYEKI